MPSKLFAFIVIIVALGVAALVYFRQPPPAPAAVEYIDEVYGFTLRHPAGWRAETRLEGGTPFINIYPPRADLVFPLTHHSNATQVSIFPAGIPTEGVFSQSTDSAFSLPVAAERATDFLLSDGTVWGRYFVLASPPPAWEPWGFVWASARVGNRTEECVEEMSCVIRGEVSPDDQRAVEEVLTSFRLLSR